MHSFLRWAGSKRQLVSRLRKYWPGNTANYFEPFCGSSSLFFEIEPENAILADINKELISTYRSIQKDVELVLENLRRYRIGKSSYYQIRKLDPNKLSEPEIAARFIYLNRLCFNGIYRTNSRGEFNVPYGNIKSKNVFNEHKIIDASKILQSATLIAGDFQDTLKFAKPGDFVYLDPPYYIKSRKVFSEYSARLFSYKDLNRLRESLEQLDKKGIFFLITYEDSQEAQNLLKPWYTIPVWVRRNVAGFSGNRKIACELLATNIENGGYFRGN